MAYESKRSDIEEFRRVQRWMKKAGKDSPVYADMKERYLDLKCTLADSGTNMDQLDIIQEN